MLKRLGAAVMVAAGAVLMGTGVASGAVTGVATAGGGSQGGLTAAMWLVRFVGYLALCVLCGGAAFLVFAWPAGTEVRRAQHLLWAGVGIGFVSSLAAVVLQVAFVTRVSMFDALAPRAETDFLTTPIGRVWAARVLLFALAVPVVRALVQQGTSAARSTAWRVGAAAVGIALLRTPGLLGHPEESRQSALGTVADLVHIAGVAVWLGGLLFLVVVVLPRRRADELAAVLPRFSSLALGSVAAVALGGLFMTWQLLGGVHAVVSTHYGHVLLIKLAAVGGVLLAASRSKAWVGTRLDHAVVLGGDRVTLRPFVVSVSTEVVLAVAALAVASVLVATPPVH